SGTGGGQTIVIMTDDSPGDEQAPVEYVTAQGVTYKFPASASTYTLNSPPANTTLAKIRCWSSGGGGGSGACQASGSAASGGAGGASGEYGEAWYPVAGLLF